MMMVFPQLQSGAIAQYPAKRDYVRQVIANSLPDGSMVAFEETTPPLHRWDLLYRDLTDAEAQAIWDFFCAAEGQHRVFTFVDPLANLLASSEDLEFGVWSRSSLLHIATEIGDPFGGARSSRLTNTAQAPQAISQTIPAPASLTYCLSAYLKSPGGASAMLSIGGDGVAASETVALTSEWRRYTVSARLQSSAESTTFSIGLAPGASVDVFGIQAEPQPRASAYKQGGRRHSVYSRARFESDDLSFTSDGPGQHRCRIRIVARD